MKLMYSGTSMKKHKRHSDVLMSFEIKKLGDKKNRVTALGQAMNYEKADGDLCVQRTADIGNGA